MISDFLRAPAQSDIVAPIPASQRVVYVRAQTTDREFYEDVFITGKYELAYSGEPELIVDCGADTAYSAVYFALRYPRATILALAPQAADLGLLKRNVEGLSNVKVVGGVIRTAESVLCHTIAGLLAQGGRARINILKLDTGGPEHDLMVASAAWIDNVDQLVVELHKRTQSTIRWAFEHAIVGRVARRVRRRENEWVVLARRR